MNQIEIKKELWRNQWEYLINNFLKKTEGLSLYSPHILIDDIITEIKENDFKNRENKKFFYKKLNEYFTSDKVIKCNFNSIFKILRVNFDTDKNYLILQTCLKIKTEFQEGVYFDKNLELLNQVICSDDEINNNILEEIKYLSQILIVEFIKKGYVLEDIKDFAKNVFDNYHMYDFNGEKYLSTDFPHNLVQENNIKTDEYYLQIKKTINNLSVTDRIVSLSKYYYKKPKKVQYIFVVEGLKGSIDIKIGNVTLYSLDKKRFIDNDKFNEENIFEQKTQINLKQNFIQVAVEVDYLLPKSSFATAINNLENILDLITCYFKLTTPLEINSSRFIIVKDGQSISSSFSREKNDKFLKFQNSIDLKDIEESLNKLTDYNYLFQPEQQISIATSRLTNAIHWYSKAEQSTREEDKMLNYWIAVENLFNYEYDIKNDVLKNNKSKIQLIQEIISSSHIFIFKYEFGWEFFHDYKHLVLNEKRSYIPEDLLDKSGLNTSSGHIYLKNFIYSLQDLIKFEKDIMYSQNMENILNFYTDNKFALKITKSQIELIEDDILMIYRLRNLIVHNAHFDNALLPYYVWKIKNYAGSLIRQLIPKINTNKSALATEMLNLYIEKEEFLKNLETNNYNFFME